MKPEEKKRLKRFWLGKGLLLASIIGSLGMTIVTSRFIHSQYSMVKKAEVSDTMKAFPGSLLKDLESTDPAIFGGAAKALGRLGDKSAVPFLLKRLNDSNPYFRRSAVEALGRLGDKSAVPFLLKRLNDSNPDFQLSAAETLGRLGDKSVLPFLLKRLNDSDINLQVSAAEALGRLGDKSALPFLLKRLNDSDSYLQDRAVEALGRLGDKSALPFLLKRLNDSDSYVWEQDAEALGRLGDKSALPFLLEVLRNRQSHYRFEAYSALKKLSESDQVAKISKPTASLLFILGGSLFLGTVFVGGMGLIFFLRMRNPYPLTWSGHLLLPEETIAELIALKRRRQKQNLPQWKLLLELTVEILLLLWAIHIQVRFQNLSLPPGKKRNID
jgi:hypothetical protein